MRFLRDCHVYAGTRLVVLVHAKNLGCNPNSKRNNSLVSVVFTGGSLEGEVSATGRAASAHPHGGTGRRSWRSQPGEKDEKSVYDRAKNDHSAWGCREGEF